MLTKPLRERAIGAVLLAMALTAPQMGYAAETKPTEAASHAGHSHGADEKIYKGYFDDAQIADRPFSDYAGDWQSLYPLLLDGTLDPVMEAKAKKGDKTAEEYKAYYNTGYKTDVQRITIDGEDVHFYRGSDVTTAKYQADGYEILTYKKGNRGVRFIFKKTEGDATAPAFLQFSDHQIAPAKAGHFHIYWGDDRAALLTQLENWPTYFGSDLKPEQIVEEMLAH